MVQIIAVPKSEPSWMKCSYTEERPYLICRQREKERERERT